VEACSHRAGSHRSGSCGFVADWRKLGDIALVDDPDDVVDLDRAPQGRRSFDVPVPVVPAEASSVAPAPDADLAEWGRLAGFDGADRWAAHVREHEPADPWSNLTSARAGEYAT
jgi:hypothetical protein